MKIKEIVMKLVKADDYYYNKSKSLLSDEEYDSLKDELRKIDPNNDYLKKIGAAVPRDTPWTTHKHLIPMTSLNKVIFEEEFVKWAREIGGTDNDLSGTFVIQEKLDGSSISLEYVNGSLKHACRRSNGVEGEDVLENIVLMKNVKTRIESFTGSIRGEIFLLAPDFKKLLEIESCKNPRNSASGIVTRFDHKYSNYLTILYYDVASEDFEWETEDEKIQFLRDHDLQTVSTHSVSTKDAIRIFNEYVASRRANLDHDIDGMVIKLNNINKQKAWGEYNKNPKAQIAWKFPPIEKTTKIVDVRWDQGRNGRLTPVAILEPTQIGGVTITHALLHNLEIFNNFNLGSGDTIVLIRSNDVIPFISGVVSKTNSKRFPIIDKCPTCSGKTTVDGKFLMCYNEDCSGNDVGHILKWIDKIGIKTLGIGKKTIELLYNHELVKNPADLYRLTVEQIETLEGQGHRSAEKIVEAVQSKRYNIPLAIFVGGLNIRGFSTEMCQLLINEGYDTIDRLTKLANENNLGKLTSIKGIGESVGNAFLSGMINKKEIIQDLLTVVKIKGKETAKKEEVSKMSGKLNKKSFCFTGAIERIDPETGKHTTRDKMWEIVGENGGEVAESITKTTTYLVQADPSKESNKTQKAKKLGVIILSEADFWKMIA